MNIAIRLGAAIALPILFAACAATPHTGPGAGPSTGPGTGDGTGQRAPNRAEVARHNATAPEQMQIVCENVADTGSLIKRRTCWLRQDMDERLSRRNTVLVPLTP